MKCFCLFYLVMVLAVACTSNDDDNFGEGLPQEWQLTAVNLGLSGEILENKDLPWQETLVFTKDSLFTRTRIFEDSTAVAIGSFVFEVRDSESYIILMHEEESELITNCTQSNEEWLRFTSQTELLGGALPCDGPGLFYKRIN